MDKDLALIRVASAFADLLEKETGGGIESMPAKQMGQLCEALEAFGRPEAAEKLRKVWARHAAMAQ